MVNSMTGFAAASGSVAGYGWTCEMRGVNAKGLDIRLRAPDWLPGLDQTIRAAIAAKVKRGNISLTLRIARDQATGAALDQSGLSAALDRVSQVEAEAARRGMVLSPVSAADVLAMQGVQRTEVNEDDTSQLINALKTEIDAMVEEFCAMRRSEGAALEAVLSGQLQDIATLTGNAQAAAAARKGDMAVALKRNLAQVLDNVEADEGRVAQELAVLAVKSDITEELDRLSAHVLAAHDLLSGTGPVGRKLDFLMQEFNREANTLCSKSLSTDLTRIGLDLKAVIDQMREQVQNVE